MVPNACSDWLPNTAYPYSSSLLSYIQTPELYDFAHVFPYRGTPVVVTLLVYTVLKNGSAACKITGLEV